MHIRNVHWNGAIINWNEMDAIGSWQIDDHVDEQKALPSTNNEVSAFNQMRNVTSMSRQSLVSFSLSGSPIENEIKCNNNKIEIH